MNVRLFLLMAISLLVSTCLEAKTKVSLDDNGKKTALTSKPESNTKAKDNASSPKGATPPQEAKPATASCDQVPEWVSNGKAIFQTVPGEIISYKKYVFLIPCETSKLPDAIYQSILQKIAKNSFVVIANPVPDASSYDGVIKRIADEIKILMSVNVPARNISVIGIGKGGQAAFRLASQLNNQDLNLVLISAIPKNNHGNMLLANAPKNLSGRVLNVYDREDEEFGSCKELFKTLEGSKSYRDLAVKSGKGGKMITDAVNLWLRPSLMWIK